MIFSIGRNVFAIPNALRLAAVVALAIFARAQHLRPNAIDMRHQDPRQLLYNK